MGNVAGEGENDATICERTNWLVYFTWNAKTLLQLIPYWKVSQYKPEPMDDDEIKKWYDLVHGKMSEFPAYSYDVDE